MNTEMKLETIKTVKKKSRFQRATTWLLMAAITFLAAEFYRYLKHRVLEPNDPSVQGRAILDKMQNARDWKTTNTGSFPINEVKVYQTSYHHFPSGITITPGRMYAEVWSDITIIDGKHTVTKNKEITDIFTWSDLRLINLEIPRLETRMQQHDAQQIIDIVTRTAK